MKAPQAALDLVKLSEACRLVAYQDSGGVWTIGWGHTKGVKEGDECTQEQADAWLVEDMQEAVDGVLRLVKVNLTQGQFAALVDFVFNEGCGQFQHSTLLRRINDRDYDLAVAEFSRWIYDDGKVLPGLVTRREREKALFRS